MPDEVGKGKGWKMAVFDAATDELKAFLVADERGCRTTADRSKATTFGTLKEAEAAAEKCGAAACPP